MGLVTFDAFPGVVVLGDDLLEPLGPGRIGFVATETKVVSRLGGQYIGIVRMLAAHPVTGFAGQGFMLEPGKFLELVRMTFIARLLARINRCARTQLHQRPTAIPAQLPE
jgi:hypothetical protein